MRPSALRLDFGWREWPEHPHPAFFAACFLVLLSAGAALSGFIYSQTTIARLDRLAASDALQPENLSGITAAQATAVFGPPDITRRETPATIWQYRQGDCVVDLFIYPVRDEQIVKHADVHARHASMKVSPAICLSRLSEGDSY